MGSEEKLKKTKLGEKVQGTKMFFEITGKVLFITSLLTAPLVLTVTSYDPALIFLTVLLLLATTCLLIANALLKKEIQKSINSSQKILLKDDVNGIVDKALK